MNMFVFMGRLTKDPAIRYTKDGKAVANFSLAVDRRFQKDATDFFDCTAFGKTAEFAEKYLSKGTKVVVSGSVQNNNYTNKDGQNIRSMAFIVDSLEFAESKKADSKPSPQQEAPQIPASDDFMNIPEGVDDSELPFI